MADISFTCPSCGQPLEVDASVAGKQLSCPSCSHSIVVPDAQPSSTRPELHDVLKKGREQARSLLNDLKSINLKEEILPLDASNLTIVLRDFVFWAVTLLGIVPLLIVTIASTQAQLTMFALFFAFVWGVIFKFFVLKDQDSWKWPLASFCPLYTTY